MGNEVTTNLLARKSFRAPKAFCMWRNITTFSLSRHLSPSGHYNLLMVCLISQKVFC
jgi:hypothetical protein